MAARIRSVKPTIWESEQIGEVSVHARLTFIGLITQADDDGRLKGSPRRLKGKLFPYDEATAADVDGLLSELADAGLIVRYSKGGQPFIFLPTWEQHQRINRRTKSALPSPFDSGVEITHGELTEDSLPEGSGREGSKEGMGGESSAVTANDAPLSWLLADLVAANDPNGVRPTVTRRWADAERLMLDKDGRDEATAQRLITWAQNDSFWKANCQSMPTFREKYGRLYAAAVESARQTKGKGEQQADQFAQAAMEAERKGQ